jgi:hypothetical protein
MAVLAVQLIMVRVVMAEIMLVQMEPPGQGGGGGAGGSTGSCTAGAGAMAAPVAVSEWNKQELAVVVDLVPLVLAARVKLM